MAASDTIDVTDLVEHMREAFVTWAVDYLWNLALAIPSVGPILKAPFVGWIAKAFFKFTVVTLSKSAVLMAFFMSTIMRKAADADDFIKAAEAMANLPKDVSDADYEKAELAKMDAFRKFVILT